MIADLGSKSCAVYLGTRPSRSVIQNALRQLRFSRKLKVNLAGKFAATRFEYFEISGGIRSKIGERRTARSIPDTHDASCSERQKARNVCSPAWRGC